MNKKLIFAEIGLNHLGTEAYAKQYLKILLKTSIDGVTFQIKKESFYKNLELYYNSKDRSFYKKIREKIFYINLFKKKKFQNLRLSNNFYKYAARVCKKNKKLLGFAVADIKKINFLHKCKIDFLKILSDDFNNINLIKKALRSCAKSILISTGFSGEKKIKKLFNKIKSKKKIILIHTRFSNTLKENALENIDFLRKKFKIKVGFGNHSSNLNIIKLSSKYRPDVVLFYVRGSKKLVHPDHKHAVPLNRVDSLCKSLRQYDPKR